MHAGINYLVQAREAQKITFNLSEEQLRRIEDRIHWGLSHPFALDLIACTETNS